jgi:hypothetical protein
MVVLMPLGIHLKFTAFVTELGFVSRVKHARGETHRQI